MYLREKKSLIDLITGGKELPIKTDVEVKQSTGELLIATALILTFGAIITAVIVSNNKK